jgi:hypothetical protein
MKKYSLLLLLTGTIVMIVLLAKNGASLITPKTSGGILNIEMPFKKTVADSIIKIWQHTTNTAGTNNIIVAKQNTWWDFLFIPFYSLFLFFAAAQLANYFTGDFNKWGKILGKAAFVVAALDIAENILLFQMLNGNTSEAVVLLTSVCAAIKWLLAIIIVLYILLTAPLAVYSKIR